MPKPSIISTSTIIKYSLLTAVTCVLFYLQSNSTINLTFLYTVLYVLIFFTLAELVDIRSATYFSTITVLIATAKLVFFLPQNPQPIFITIFVQLIVSIYYFLIKDIRRNRYEAANEREKHFRTLINYSPQPMIIKNREGGIIFASESMKDVLSLDNNFAFGKNLSQYLHPDDINKHNDFLELVKRKPYERFSTELRLKKGHKDWIWIRNDSVNLLEHKNVQAIVSSIQDITLQKQVDREKAEILKEEKQARADAEKAIKDRDEFLSIASHELKTPLTTVLLQLQTTLRKISTQSLSDFSGAELLRSLQIAERQSQQLSTLIKDLLNVSLASTGRLTLSVQKVELGKLVESILDKYSQEIEMSKTKVTTSLQPEVFGNWDSVRIEQAITNLLINALKYAQGKEIKITVSKTDNEAVFKIYDSGEGIDEKLQSQIFRPFSRANTKNGVQGLGVGLFITKQIVNEHGGEIKLSSQKGKGATFSITLPIKSTSK